uniref:phage tailspike protein n=1 Tax=Yersinia sp. 2105 StPb PI TaxID=2507058 RepID=UPI00102816B9
MPDIIPNIPISMPSRLFTMPRKFGAIFGGRIYIGEIDTDPTIPSNQIQVFLENEDGSHVPVAQPLLINAGGYPVYNGQIAKFVTAQGYSMAVYDALNVQQFYFPNLSPPTAGDSFGSVADVQVANIPSTTKYINVDGYYSAGDGGAANYKQVASEPTHPGKIQSADGNWWEFVGIEINLYQTGCKGDSTSGVTGSGTDDTLSFMKARDVALALGIPVIIPALPSAKAFRLTSRITHSNTITYAGSGANVTTGLAQNYPNGGSWLYFDHLDEGMRFRDEVTPSNSDQFIRTKGFGIDRNQTNPASGWTPSAAAHDFRFEFAAEMYDMCFLKSSKIALIRGAGKLQTQSIKGQPLVVGFECERSADVQRWIGDH